MNEEQEQLPQSNPYLDYENYQDPRLSQVNDENLIKWQLDLKKDLDEIEHLLRGEKMVKDEEGEWVWKASQVESNRPFNEKGVAMIMNIIKFYLNRNTLLANYEQDIINEKMEDFSNELTNLIFTKYDEMGMNTPEKRKMYDMMVLAITDSIHSAYQRAWNGGERTSLREARSVHQTEAINPQSNPNRPQTQQGGFSLNPFKWIKR